MTQSMSRHAVEALCQATGWEAPEPTAAGLYCFDLEIDLSFCLYSPDGASLLLQSSLADFTTYTVQEDELLARLLALNAVKLLTSGAVLALDEKHCLILYERFVYQMQDAGALLRRVERFLNEVEFWRAQLRPAQSKLNGGDESLFSLSRKRR